MNNQNKRQMWQQNSGTFTRGDTIEIENMPTLGLQKQNAGGLAVPQRKVPEIQIDNLSNQRAMGGGGDLGPNLISPKRAKTKDQVLQEMVNSIQRSRVQIQTLNDFFVPFDAHQQREFEAWEIQQVFSEKLTKDDAELIVKTLGQRSNSSGQMVLPYTQLLSALSYKQSQYQVGVVHPQSVFAMKNKSTQLQQILGQIHQFFKRRNWNYVQGYESLIKSSLMNITEFQQMLNSLGVNFNINDAQQAFQYFLVAGEAMINKINFVQGMIHFSQSGNANPIMFEALQRKMPPQLDSPRFKKKLDIQLPERDPYQDQYQNQNQFGNQFNNPINNQNQFQNQNQFNQGNQLNNNNQQWNQQNNQFNNQNQFNHNQSDGMGGFNKNNFGGPGQFNQPNSNVLQTFLTAFRHQMTSLGLSFENVFLKFNVHLSAYIEPTVFEELCLKLGLQFSQNEVQQLIGTFATDYNGKVKTQELKSQVEQLGGVPNFGGLNNNNNFGGAVNNFGNSGNNFGNNMGNNIGGLGNNIGGFGNNMGINNFGNAGRNFNNTGGLNNNDYGNNFNNSNGFGGSGGAAAMLSPTSFMNQQNQLKQEYLTRIRQWIISNKIQNLRWFFNTTSVFQGREVVELQEFLNFLQGQWLNFNQHDSYNLASNYLFQQQHGNFTKQLIDRDAFEKDLFDKQSNMNYQYQQHRTTREVLTQIYKSIKKYIMINGGNIWRFFQEADKNNDNFISKAELKIALENIGHMGLTEQDLTNIYQFFDQNQDGRISYQELCRQFEEFSNTKAIKDRSHKLYYVFENIRNRCQNFQQSLASIFGLNDLRQFSFRDKVYISKDQFFQTLANLRIPMSPQVEKELLELLDADQAHQYQIDFVHFSDLLGLNYQNSNFINLSKEYSEIQPLQVNVYNQAKRFNRQLYDLLQSRSCSISNLLGMFRLNDFNGIGQIPFDSFIKVILSLDAENRLDQVLLRETAQRFLVQGSISQMINYKDFLNRLEFEFEKYKIINTIFLTIQVSMNNYNAKSLQEFFQKQIGMMTFNAMTLKDAFEKMGIWLKEHEITMVLLEYDPNGNGRQLDFKSFEKDFNEFVQGKSELYQYQDRRKQQVLAFDRYISERPFPKEVSTEKAMTSNLKQIFRKIGNFLDGQQNFNLQDILMEHDKTRSGILRVANFQTILDRDFNLTNSEVQQVVMRYDPHNRNSIKIREFLEDIKEFVKEVPVKVKIMSIVSDLGGKEAADIGQNPHLVLSKYQQAFEEIQRVLIIKNYDVYKWAQNYSSMQSRQALSRNDFRSAINSLTLTTLTAIDIDTIFDAISGGQTNVEISKVDDVIRRYSQKNSIQMQDDIMESIIKAFNGDDNYILKELSAVDRSGRGLVDLPLFESFFSRNTPQHIQQFTQNDLKYLGLKYTNSDQRYPDLVDINKFHADFKKIRNAKGIYNGTFGGPLSLNTMNNGSFGAGVYNEHTVGHRNPLMPQYSSKNTRAEKLNVINPNFRINLEQEYLEGLAKGTYIKELSVYEYFLQFIQRGNGEIIQETEFQRAIMGLNLGWTRSITENVLNQIDIAFNGMRNKMMITPKEIDEAVSLGMKRTLDQIHNDELTLIAKFISQKGIDIRQEIKSYDRTGKREVSIKDMCTIVLDALRVPLMEFDIIFLCKKYIDPSLQNYIQYEKMLDDIEAISRGTGQSGGFRGVCEYIRKGCIIQKRTVEEYFMTFSRQKKDMLTFAEFSTGITQLGLIPILCNEKQVQQLFTDMNSQNLQWVSIQQVANYIARNSSKSTQEMQDEILKQIASYTQSQNIANLNVFFRQDDAQGRQYVPIMSFALILQRNFQIKDIDARLVAQRYSDNREDRIAYLEFITDVQYKQKTVKNIEPVQINTGLSGGHIEGDPTKTRLKGILSKISQFVEDRGIALGQIFAIYEKGRSTGTIPQRDFLNALDQAGLPLQGDEKFFIAENYKVFRSNNEIDYRQMIEDMRIYVQEPARSTASLTKDQEILYKQTSNHLKSKDLLGAFVENLINRDKQRKNYLPREDIEQSFIQIGMKLGNLRFENIFAPLDKNRSGEYSYKHLLDILFGAKEANEILSGTFRGNKQTAAVQFKMPQQTIGASNALMAQLGQKMIKSNINYENEFARIVNPNQLNTVNIRVTEDQILGVFIKCGVSMTAQERTEFRAHIMAKIDNFQTINLLEFLQAIGLPAQTLGPQASKGGRGKKLNAEELKSAQALIFKIRQFLNSMKKNPLDVFAKCKNTEADKSIPVIKFKMALVSELGGIGQQITDNQISLLTYYLEEEIQNEISIRKLQQAFLLTDRDPPLTQFGQQEFVKYEQQLRRQMTKGTPLEVIDLIDYIQKNQIPFNQIFKSTQKGLISRQEFETALKEVGYMSQDMESLILALDTKGNRQTVSLDKLNGYMGKMNSGGQKVTPSLARERYQGFDAKIKQYLQKISDYLKRNNITMQRMHEEMDVNKDGVVDKNEFVTRMQYIYPDIGVNDLGQIFDAIDINNDNTLSLNEFGMFIEGAKATRDQRLREIDPKILSEMHNEIEQLFRQFDANNDGTVNAQEIYMAMMAIGQRINMEDAQLMIQQVKPGADRLTQTEFTQLLMPKMQEELMQQEESLEDFRALFLDADIDHSGTLSVDEIYSVIKKMGATVTLDEIIELMNEIDVDRNGELDIDEFIALMSLGDEIQFRNAQSKNTLMHIKKARKLNPLDFFRCFKSLPMNFVPSFIGEKWNKQKKNLPSSVFIPQIDPRTMLYKDLYPVLTENLAPTQNQRAFQPRVRPLPIELAAQILLEGGTGVPLPQTGQNFDRNQIVKRAVRICLYDAGKKDFIFNAVQVNALYNQGNEDIWQFNAWKDNGSNPILFKTSDKDDVAKPNIFIIFELVIYVKFNEAVKEISCGWCQFDVSKLDREMTHKLPIKGGSPNAEMIIKDSDVHTNRSGLKAIAKTFTQKIQSQLTIQIRPHTKFTPETKFHLEMLPSTCLIQKRLLYFVSGFRNYIGEKLLKQSAINNLKHPEGDVIISSFPKILDCPDICEQVIIIWSEDVWSGLNTRQKQNVDTIMLKSKDFIQKLYPVLYADEFKFKESSTTFSAAGDSYLMKKREDLVKSALRFGNQQAKTKVDRPIEMLTTFKPFTIRELEFEVWDTSKSKNDRYMKQYENLGLLNGSRMDSQNNSAIMPNLNQGKSLLGPNNNVLFGQNAQQQLEQPPQLGLYQAPSLNTAFNQRFNK